MTEWSEYFCKAMNKNIDEMKVECDKCTSGKCSNDTEGKFCIRCKEKCKSYSEFINKWKEQLETQSKSYKKLYEMSETYSSFSEDVKLFVKKLKENQKDCSVKNAFEYIHKTSNCVNYKFNENDGSSNKRTYAFEETPNSYKEACTCTSPTKNPLDDCPTDQTKDGCKELQSFTFCTKNDYDNNLDNWNSHLVLNSSDDNKGVLIPPRRRHLCTRPITRYIYRNDDKEIFKKHLLTSAFSQGQLLGQKYKSEKELCFEAMKYSFADYADIIKGTDMLDTTTSKKINKRLLELLNVSNNVRRHATSWWENNRSHVWHAMLCGYQKAGGEIEKKDCELPNEDEIPQFLRWLIEWAKQACKEEQILKNSFETKCNCTKIEEKAYSEILEKINCKGEIIKYINWINKVKLYYDGLNGKYQRFIKSSATTKVKQTQPNAHDYIKVNYPECNFDFSKIYEIYNNNIQDNNVAFKEILKIFCPKLNFDNDVIPEQITEKKETLPLPSQYDSTNDILTNTIPFGIALALCSVAFLFMK
ncbi:hypothetical protein PFTANZ_05821, partial [Plasmodium falciparum Tanzania (2000708)]